MLRRLSALYRRLRYGREVTARLVRCAGRSTCTLPVLGVYRDARAVSEDTQQPA